LYNVLPDINILNSLKKAKAKAEAKEGDRLKAIANYSRKLLISYYCEEE